LNGKLSQSVRKHYDDAVTTGVNVTESCHYTGLGGRVSSRDTVVTSTSAFLGASFTTSVGYNTLGLTQQIIYPQCAAPAGCVGVGRPNVMGASSAFYSYSNGWMTYIGSDGPAYGSVTYQPSGLVDTISHGNGVNEQWIGDPNGMARPCAIFATGGGTTLQNSTSGTCGKVISSGPGIAWTTGQYAFDGAGNVTQIGTKKYLYDAVDRLTTESDGYTNTSASYSLLNTYSYDVFGNMTRRTNGQSYLCNADFCDGYERYNTTVINVASSTNRLQSPDTYDAAGNLTSHATKRTTQSFAWDPVGTMRTLSDTAGRNVHYLYTADDERIAVIAPAGSGNQTTWSLRGFSDQLLRRFSDDTSTSTRVWSWNEDEIWRGAFPVANESASGTKHYVLDHLGSPRLVTGANATWLGTNEFSAYGMGGTPGSGALQFTGHERDWGVDAEQTLDYMHARYYSASLGRFTSVDTGTATPHSPQSWHRYVGIANNPLSYKDPDGRAVVAIRFEHFIPVARAYAPHGIFHGDNRGFSTSASRTFRTQQTIYVETDKSKSPSGVAPGRPSVPGIGSSFNYLPQLWGNPPRTGQASGASFNYTIERTSDNFVVVHATQDEEVPKSVSWGMGLWGTGIRSDVIVAIGPDGEVSGVGTRSEYPAFQISVQVDGGAEQIVYAAPAEYDGVGIFFDDAVEFYGYHLDIPKDSPP
jgi:RHS repeat-associated protein